MPESDKNKGKEHYVSSALLAEQVGKARGTVQRALTRMWKNKRTTWKTYRILVKRGKDGGWRLERMSKTERDAGAGESK
jgi:hypothetical protein